MSGSGLNSLSTQPSLDCSSTASPPMGVVTTVDGMGSSHTDLSAPPARPRRTTCVLSSQKDLFAPTSPGVTRPHALIPQVQQCSPVTMEHAGPLKLDRLLIHHHHLQLYETVYLSYSGCSCHSFVRR
ncbi:hypothetical protein CSKR_113767 [Clonorchis sinensis]|uniref:Uncharacterized protein n=1 Tax=Clonorchis sinensis TaxID=79923 RepID=A0A419Q710_CLOSI|nr:hypothetical protein CSKR_113767 [Clonorchis sinensis]